MHKSSKRENIDSSLSWEHDVSNLFGTTGAPQLCSKGALHGYTTSTYYMIIKVQTGVLDYINNIRETRLTQWSHSFALLLL